MDRLVVSDSGFAFCFVDVFQSYIFLKTGFYKKLGFEVGVRRKGLPEQRQNSHSRKSQVALAENSKFSFFNWNGDVNMVNSQLFGLGSFHRSCVGIFREKLVFRQNGLVV